MSDLPPRPPFDSEDERERELSASAYEASVPGRMGFRGTNPLAFVIAGVVGLGIVLFAAVAFFRHGAPPDASRTALIRNQQNANAQPAAPGVGGPVQTPFIPAGTPPPPTAVVTPIPFLPLPAPLPQTAAPVAYSPPPIPTEQPRQIVPAPAEAAPNDEMAIAQPSGAPAGAASAAPSDSEAGTHYVPVYRDGQVVSVVAVPNSPAPAASSASLVATAAPQSGQFVTGGTGVNPAALGAGNAGLLEARRFTAETSDGQVGYVRPNSSRQLATATVLNARLMSKIESDLPGPVIAQITQPVYDSSTHTTVVIPAGTRVFGRYDEETVASSTRVLMSFTRIIFPDGEEFDLGGQPASDSIGAAGLAGDVDKHRGSLYTSALLLTVLGAAEAAVTPQTNTLTNGVSVSQEAQSAAGAELDSVANKLISNSIDRPATVIIRPPYAFQIIVTRDLPLDEYAAQHQ